MELGCPHILVECQVLIPSVRIGVLEALKELEKQGKCEVRFRRLVEIRRRDIVWSDAVVMVRACEPIELALAREIKRHGRYLAYFLDDDLLHLPENTGSFAYFHQPCIQRSLKEILSISDLLWGVNSFLIEQYQQYCPGETLLLRVPVKLTQRQEQATDDCVRLLYAGSTDHEPLVQAFLSPAVERLAREQGERLQALFIGVDPQIAGLKNVQVKKFIDDYDAYRRLVHAGNFDIGLAIIRETDFYRCKYYNKFVEYTAIGAVGVYTASEPYTLVIEDQKNGFLCENTVESWYQTLRAVILDADARKQTLAAATALVQAMFSHTQVADRLYAVEGLFAGNAPKITAGQVKLDTDILQFCFRRTVALFQKKGLRAIPEIWVKGWRLIRNCLKTLLQKQKT